MTGSDISIRLPQEQAEREKTKIRKKVRLFILFIFGHLNNESINTQPYIDATEIGLLFDPIGKVFPVS